MGKRTKNIASLLFLAVLFYIQGPLSYAQEKSVSTFMRDAQKLYTQGSYEKAALSSKKALKIDPDYFPAYNMLADIYSRRGGFEEEAIAYLEKSLAINPAQAELYNNLSFLYNKIGKVDESVVYMKKGLKHDPENFSLNFNLGLTYLLYKHEPSNALGFLTKAYRKRPDFDKIYFLLGITYLSLNDRVSPLEFVTKLRESKNEYLAAVLEDAIRKANQGQTLEMGSLVQDYSKQPKKKAAPAQNKQEEPSVEVSGQDTQVSGSGVFTIKRVFQPKTDSENQ